jgi:hypothetical protein
MDNVPPESEQAPMEPASQPPPESVVDEAELSAQAAIAAAYESLDETPPPPPEPFIQFSLGTAFLMMIGCSLVVWVLIVNSAYLNGAVTFLAVEYLAWRAWLYHPRRPDNIIGDAISLLATLFVPLTMFFIVYLCWGILILLRLYERSQA